MITKETCQNCRGDGCFNAEGYCPQGNFTGDGDCLTPIRDALFEEMEKTLKWTRNWECETRCYFPFGDQRRDKIHLVTCQRLTTLVAKIDALKGES